MSIPFVVEVNDETFECEVLNAATPVLVDFYMPYCGPCEMLAPIIDELSIEFQGRVKVCKIEAEASPRTSVKYGILAAPTVIIFKNGQPVASVRGYQAKQRIVAELKRVAG